MSFDRKDWERAIALDAQGEKDGQPFGRNSIRQAFGVSENEARCIRWALTNKNLFEGEIVERSQWKETREKDRITLEATGRFDTVEEAIAYADVDMSVWKVVKVIVNGWDVTMKLGTPDLPKPHTVQNKQIKLDFQRKISEPVQNAYEALLDRAKQHSPVYTPIQRNQPTGKKRHCMLEINMPDVHWGMLAWGKETGSDWDIKIAERVYHDAGETLLQRALSNEFFIEQIILPVGSDFFHTNDQTNQTPKEQNRLDVDTRLAKIFETAHMGLVNLIDVCRQVAPVHVPWIPGNHDEQSSWFLAKNLESWYRQCEDVTFDVASSPRKRYLYGKTLIGYTHGGEEKERDLVGIMAGTWPEEWAASHYREWHIGHRHKKKEMFVLVGDTYSGGVWVRMVPSLSAKDYWHSSKGYMSVRAAEAFLYDFEYGPIETYSTNIRELDG